MAGLYRYTGQAEGPSASLPATCWFFRRTWPHHLPSWVTLLNVYHIIIKWLTFIGVHIIEPILFYIIFYWIFEDFISQIQSRSLLCPHRSAFHNLVVSRPPKKEKEKEEKYSNLSCRCTYWVKLLVASPLTKTESFATCTPTRGH